MSKLASIQAASSFCNVTCYRNTGPAQLRNQSVRFFLREFLSQSLNANGQVNGSLPHFQILRVLGHFCFLPFSTSNQRGLLIADSSKAESFQPFAAVTTSSAASFIVISSRREVDERDRADYQTMFAREEGSVAAPTAGLHFTDALTAGLREAGIDIHRVTLHVGPGTFLPVKADDISGHTMHPEWAAYLLEPQQP